MVDLRHCFYAATSLLVAVTAATEPAVAAPANVYVICENNYKSPQDGDSFNNAANAEAFKAAGFFGGDGEIFRVVGNDVKRGGNVVGAVVRDDQSRILYYKNPNDSVRVYPISAGPSTVNDAWMAVAADGRLTIATHGARGAMVLDGNKLRQGFRCAGTMSVGTGRNDLDNVQPPLDLTPRKANITIDLNGCLTATDPDADGPQRSVVSSASDVCGVTSATGNDGLVTKQANVFFGGTVAQKNAALAALVRLAGGQDKLNTYFASRSLGELLATGAQLEDAHGITFKIRSTKTRPTTLRDSVERGSSDLLVAAMTTDLVLDEVGASGGTLVFPRSPEPVLYSLAIPANATGSTLPVLLHPAAIEMSIWPAGTRPASTAVRFGPYPDDPWLLAVPATLTIHVPRPQDVVGFYQVVDSTLIPLAFNVDTINETVSAEVGEAGVYAVFEVPPTCPGDANADGLVDSFDLSVLLATFGQNADPGTGADFNSDGVVNAADLSLLLSSFYKSC